MSNWKLTDDDTCQYVKQNTDTEFSLIEMCLIDPENNLYEVYTDTVGINDYLKSDTMQGILDAYGHQSIENMSQQYKDSAMQVIAECVFEYYGSFQASVVFAGKEDECRQFISQYVA